MAATLTFGPQLSGVGTYNAGEAVSRLVSQINLGQNNFGVTIPNLNYGTAATYVNNILQVNDWYTNTLTIASTVTYSLNFNTGADKNPFGVALAWTKVKMVIIAVQSPDGVLSVQVGPNAVVDAAPLWFGAATANIYETVYFTGIWIAPPAGWAITNTTSCLLPIHNPGGTSVDVAVFAAGKF